nr:MAG TPA: hypothetical protein [Caudoviricetes sp.]
MAQERGSAVIYIIQPRLIVLYHRPPCLYRTKEVFFYGSSKENKSRNLDYTGI